MFGYCRCDIFCISGYRADFLLILSSYFRKINRNELLHWMMSHQLYPELTALNLQQKTCPRWCREIYVSSIRNENKNLTGSIRVQYRPQKTLDFAIKCFFFYSTKAVMISSRIRSTFVLYFVSVDNINIYHLPR